MAFREVVGTFTGVLVVFSGASFVVICGSTVVVPCCGFVGVGVSAGLDVVVAGLPTVVATGA